MAIAEFGNRRSLTLSWSFLAITDAGIHVFTHPNRNLPFRVNSPSIAPARRHSRWQQVLQIAGAIAIVAFHVQAPFSQMGWAAVEVFFVMAGMNMASSLNRDLSVAAYARQRFVRLLPELTVVWLATLAFVIAGRGSAGMAWFLGSAPFQLQNLTPLFFKYDLPRDAVFGPLWFLGTLFQLQVIVFALRKVVSSARPLWIIAGALCVGVSARLIFALWKGHALELDGSNAGVLYCMPFCHLEAMILGVLLGRGAWPRFGRILPWGIAIAVAVGLLNVWLPGGKGLGTLGFEFPPRIHGSHLWAYPLLAFASAILCAKDGMLAEFVEGIRIPGWIERGLANLAPLTYGVYCFHGLVIATGINGAAIFGTSLKGRIMIWVITFLEALIVALIVNRGWQWALMKSRFTKVKP